MLVKAKTLLIVEDQKDIVLLLKAAFRQANFGYPVHFAFSGEEALERLLGEDGDPSDRWVPHVILLDLNLPGISGFDVLRAVKADRDCRKAAVLINSTSNRQEDIDRAYALGASAYIVKLLSVTSLVRLAESLKEFWFELNVGPSVPGRRPGVRAEVPQWAAL